jgi:hypothetical protein
MSLIFDEYGRPFIILREQQQQARIKGLEAQKANILAGRSVSSLLRTSLGPKGNWFAFSFNVMHSLTLSIYFSLSIPSVSATFYLY